MIPLVAGPLAALGAGRRPITLAWCGAAKTTNAFSAPSTWSTGTIALGAEHPRRWLVALIHRRGNTLRDVAIAGVAAAKIGEEGTSGNGSTEIWIARVPTGTSGTVTMGTWGTTSSVALALWSILDLNDPVLRALVIAHNADPASLAVPVVAGQAVLGFAYDDKTDNAMAWSGLSEHVDQAIGPRRFSAASAVAAAGGTLAASCNLASADNHVLALVLM